MPSRQQNIRSQLRTIMSARAEELAAGFAGCPFEKSEHVRDCFLSMNRKTPTVQSERGLSQTAARMLARALNLPRRVAWRSAASWDNSRSGAKAGSWPVSRSDRNKEPSMNRSAGLRPGSFRFMVPMRGHLGPWELPLNPKSVQRNTSPRPSPSGKGRVVSALVGKSAAGFAGCAFEKPEHVGRCSLSPRERVRVRGNAAHSVAKPFAPAKHSDLFPGKMAGDFQCPL
jgi:hypothetical protein